MSRDLNQSEVGAFVTASGSAFHTGGNLFAKLNLDGLSKHGRYDLICRATGGSISVIFFQFVFTFNFCHHSILFSDSILRVFQSCFDIQFLSSFEFLFSFQACVEIQVLSSRFNFSFQSCFAVRFWSSFNLVLRFSCYLLSICFYI